MLPQAIKDSAQYHIDQNFQQQDQYPLVTDSVDYKITKKSSSNSSELFNESSSQAIQRLVERENNKEQYEQLKLKVQEQRQMIREYSNVLQIKDLENIKQSKAYIEKKEKMFAQKQAILENQIDKEYRAVIQRKEKIKQDLEQLQIRDSIQDCFEQKTENRKQNAQLKQFENILNTQIKDRNNQKSIEHHSGEPLFFGLTNPVVTEQSADKIGTKNYQIEPQVNPFQNKETWEKLIEAERKGEAKNFRFPGIGYENTPLYRNNQIELQNIKRKQRLRIHFSTNLQMAEKQQTLNFQNIYGNIKDVTRHITSSPHLYRSFTTDLLSHQLQQAVEFTKQVWGNPDSDDRHERNQSLSPQGSKKLDSERYHDSLDFQSPTNQSYQNKSSKKSEEQFFYTKGHQQIKIP